MLLYRGLERTLGTKRDGKSENARSLGESHIRDENWMDGKEMQGAYRLRSRVNESVTSGDKSYANLDHFKELI